MNEKCLWNWKILAQFLTVWSPTAISLCELLQPRFHRGPLRRND